MRWRCLAGSNSFVGTSTSEAHTSAQRTRPAATSAAAIRRATSADAPPHSTSAIAWREVGAKERGPRTVRARTVAEELGSLGDQLFDRPACVPANLPDRTPSLVKLDGPAAHVEDLAGDLGGLVRGEVDDHRRHVLGGPLVEGALALD